VEHARHGDWPSDYIPCHSSTLAGKESEYFGFLAEHLSDLVVNAGILRGGQEFTDWWLKKEHSEGVPTGLAQYILTEV
jgi:hypothetical protein